MQISIREVDQERRKRRYHDSQRKADELLENHKPVELDKDTTKALDQIVENFKGKL